MVVSEYPRVLLVSASVFNEYSGGGVMLTNLFRGWPVDRIGIVHTDWRAESREVCQQFYRLCEAEIQWTGPRWLRSGRLSGWSLRKARRSSDADDGNTDRLNGERISYLGGRPLRDSLSRLGGQGLIEVPFVTERLKGWVGEFRPEIIYTLLGSLSYIRLTRRLASLFNVPMAVHMMDDWPAVIYCNKGPFGRYLRMRLRAELSKVLDSAAVRMGICEKMCRAFEARYGQPFVPFQNALDVRGWLANSRKDWDTHRPFRMVYAGAIIHNSNRESLRDISDAVAGLHSSGVEVEMRLHCPHIYADRFRSDLERRPSVIMDEPPSQENIASIFGSADLLVLPVNFDGESIRYIRYSMPAKVPAYMISGTPVLVYGPAGVASVEYAQEGRWGYVVPRKGIPGLQEAIRVLVSDRGLRASLGQRAQELAVQNHDAAKIRPAFRQALARAAACRVP